MTSANTMQPNNPTPEQIKAACLEIQAGWTDQERQRRLRCDWRSVAENQTSLEPHKAPRHQLSK